MTLIDNSLMLLTMQNLIVEREEGSKRTAKSKISDLDVSSLGVWFLWKKIIVLISVGHNFEAENRHVYILFIAVFEDQNEQAE